MTKGSIGETLKQLRQARQLTQKMLATGICAQSVISRAENNEELPNVLVLHQICERLNITMDQLLLSQSLTIRENNETFRLVHHYFVKREYEAVAFVLKDPKLLESLYLETDLQLYYYYYLGSCEYFLEKDYVAAIQSLKKGLSYTYNQEKVFVSSIEIQIMSCMGYVLKESGQLLQAENKLSKSYQFINKLPSDRKSFKLIKVYYHYGEFLYEQGAYVQAFEVVKEGLLLVQQCCSYYYLEELFHLNSLILEELEEVSEALKYGSFARRVKEIRLFK